MKQTEVGLIPDDWEVETIAKTCNVFTGGECPEKWSINQNDIFQFPIYSNGRECYGYTDNYKINHDAVCISSIGENTGDVFFYEKCFTPIIRLKVIIPKNNNIDTKCLFYILSKYRIDGTKNGGIPNINAQDVKVLKFPLPPLNEQKKIAVALSDIDSLICGIEEEIEKKKNIKTGAMQELLTGKRRLPGFAKSDKTKMTELGEIPDDWEVKNVGSLLKIGHGRDYKVLKAGNVPVYGTGGYMTSVNQYLYEGETVCIGRKGTIDKPFYYEGKIWTVDTLFYTYDFVNCIPKYIYYSFCLIDWLSMNEASGVPSLTSKNIEDVLLRIPSKNEQATIASILSDMDSEINKLESKLSKYKKIKDGMMQQLLTGKIRLK